MIKAAIFDMDGLLVDSESCWQRSHVEVLARYGHHITRADARALAGARTSEIAKIWITRFELDIGAKQLADELTETAHATILESGQVLPGAEAALRLFVQHQIPMAVASSATPKDIELVMTKIGLGHYFQFLQSAIHEPEGKPHPGVFLTTARRLGAEPVDCLVFEDALNGVRAAKAAGMKCIAVPEAANRHMPEFERADRILDSLTQLDWPMVEGLFA